MKETKVYVDVEPRKMATQLVDLENEQFNCVILMFDTDVKPIEVIVEPKFKDHDRELVKEVCEKIKLKFSDTRTHNWGIEQFELYEFLDQLQKEFEK